MASIPSSEQAKPTGAAPVIRRVVFAEESLSSRVLKKYVPAWVFSGVVHVAFILIAVFMFGGDEVQTVKADSEKIVTAVEEEKKDKEDNLTETDIGFDDAIKAATESPREEAENVDAPTNPNEAIGTPMDASELPSQSSNAPSSLTNAEMTGSPSELTDKGLNAAGAGGMTGSLSVAGMKGRSGSTKDAMIKAGGGNSMTEAAVAEGLLWLSKQQQSGGHWEYDGSSKADKIAATGMALLPFLAAGETHKTGKKYTKYVAGGVEYLKSKLQKSTGTFSGSSGMYAHAIATIALCEAYGMTMDPSLKPHAQLAVTYIVNGQGANGSWGYAPKTNGDTSIVGWQIQAIKSGKLCGLSVPENSFKKAVEFLESVSGSSGATYGYSSPGTSINLNPVGLLCRYYTGWGPKNPNFARGVDVLMATPPEAPTAGITPNMYALYYSTQVVHFFEGTKWFDIWNPKMQTLMLGTQIKTVGATKGSWNADKGSIGDNCGRLGTTCLALLTLEVYYRHLPLYKRGGGGLAVLENGN